MSQTDSFTFVANDGLLDSEPATVTINYTGINETPSALPDAYATVGGCAVVTDAVTGLLANDSDGDGDLITATLVTPPNHGSVDIRRWLIHLRTKLTSINPIVSPISPRMVSVIQSLQLSRSASTAMASWSPPKRTAIAMTDSALCEAIQAANTDTVIDTCMAGAGSDRILFGLSSATYPLSLSGVNEEVNGSGDLDILA